MFCRAKLNRLFDKTALVQQCTRAVFVCVGAGSRAIYPHGSEGNASGANTVTRLFNMVREMCHVGNNMRQIAQRAYTQKMIDAPLYEENARRILNACDDLMMVCLPRK